VKTKYLIYPALFFLIKVCLITPVKAMPENYSLVESETRQAGIFIANDARYTTFSLLADEDRYYSQGLHVFWITSPRLITSSSGWLHMLGREMNAESISYAIKLGQDIFTPNDLRAEAPLVRDDRVFLGWSHVSLAQRLFFSGKGKPERLQIQLDLGVVGPWSGAGQVQTLFHEFRRSVSSRPELDPDPSKGWEEQYGKTGFPGRFQLYLDFGKGYISHEFNNKLKLNIGNEFNLQAGMLYGNIGYAPHICFGLLKRELYKPGDAEIKNSWEVFIFGRSRISAVAWNQALTGGPGSEVELSQFLWQNEFGLVVKFPFHLEYSLTFNMWSRETFSKPQEPFQAGHIDYRPELQDRHLLFDHGFGIMRLSWHW
jgi:hypothetical protein